MIDYIICDNYNVFLNKKCYYKAKYFYYVDNKLFCRCGIHKFKSFFNRFIISKKEYNSRLKCQLLK